MYRVLAVAAAPSLLAGCNASTMSGFAEAARDDRLSRENPYAYQHLQSEREMREMRREMKELEDAQEDLCRSNGGYMIGSSCVGTSRTRYY